MTLITHHGITLEITDTLTFEMARLLWKDISKEYETPPLTITTYGATRTNDICLTDNSQTTPRLSVSLGGSGYRFIRAATSLEECFEKFPNVSHEDIERIWNKAHPTTMQGKIALKVREATEGRISNFDNGRWSDQEIAAISTAANVQEAIKAYHEKFPESSRNDNAVEQKFNKMRAKAPKAAPAPERIADTKPVFFVGAQVKQIGGKNPAFGTGDITKIHPNGSITVEFYDQTKTLRPEELDFYHKNATAEEKA